MTVFIVVISILWILASHLEMQKVMRWWYRKQLSSFNHQAEEIRNGVIQELFGIRRDLELRSMDEPALGKSFPYHRWIDRLEYVQQMLEALSYQWSPPFVEDSLVLAIHHAIAPWRDRYPSVSFRLLLATDWQHEMPEVNRMLITAIEELLRAAQLELETQNEVEVTLHRRARLGELVIRIQYTNEEVLKRVLYTKDVVYLREVFQALGLGWCVFTREAMSAVWTFQWKLSTPTPATS